MNLNELNEQSYTELEDYWVRVFLNVVQDQDKENWVIPYYNTTYSNGQKIIDMNPIFSAKSKINHKSIRIIHETDHEEDDVHYWLDTNGKNELVIICPLSQQHVRKVKGIIERWIYE
ncbi:MULTISPECIES: hypothetical protein [Paenibacillus]|uniref:DUF1801 domain-containing protein n=1 Tax=Paenibacillus ottowii TaxID=2315729 RepID=A0ABY3B2Y2_9BACL|nr:MULTISPECIES: hypothetical protein [Paenibacillus]KZE77783.1 hypothetical protein AV545_10045 [Paenibacillus jamilae]NEU28740.1 hypothetical protein [Paenibacillus polymyxa]TQR98145.1 hypothetical protein FKV70_13310 [Paenibacillus ottowii]